jgi:hypothetical protein
VEKVADGGARLMTICHSWMHRFRKLVPHYEKTDLSYCARLHLAAAMITLDKVMLIYG